MMHLNENIVRAKKSDAHNQPFSSHSKKNASEEAFFAQQFLIYQLRVILLASAISSAVSCFPLAVTAAVFSGR